jgi:chromosome segregation protein
MSATDRHVETVSSIAEDAGAVPIGPVDVPRITSKRLKRARAAAAKAIADTERRRARAAATLRAAEEARQAALNGVRENEAAVSAARDLRSAAEVSTAAAEEDIRSVGARAAELDVLLESDRRRVEALEDLTAEVGRVLDVVDGGVLEPAEVQQVAKDCAVVRASVATAGLDDHSTAFERWAEALREGTAPIDPRATRLLEAMVETDRRWEALGAGDVAADPAVMAARADVLSWQATVSELEVHARTGLLGEQTRRAIEHAHARRVELEGQGRKADPEALAEAIAAEAEALGHVGFDSMLDFRIVMSSTGLGALAGKRRETAEAHLASAERRFDEALETSRRSQEEVASLRRSLATQAGELTGGDDGARDRLRRLFAVPDEVRAGADAVADTLRRAESELEQLLDERRTVDSNRADAERRLANAVAAGDTAGERSATAEAAHGSSVRDLAEAEESLVAAKQHLDALDEERAARESLRAELAGRRYVDDDVTALEQALLAQVLERAAEVRTDGDGPAAVVVDDPLEMLDTPDALAVFDAVLALDVEAPVVFVTSRPALVARARHSTSTIRCVDSRRRLRAPGRWSRRRRERLATVAS